MAAKILIVEDQPSIAELMDLHLRATGYEVAVAEDAIVAGRMILEARPDLLLVDVSLPYMSGHDFVATLVADQTIPHIPVIFITGDQSFGPRAAMLGAGVITKPCEAGTLVALVERMLMKVQQPAVEATARLEPSEKQAAA
jgi:DNA-binding response OmpR family regulator